MTAYSLKDNKRFQKVHKMLRGIIYIVIYLVLLSGLCLLGDEYESLSKKIIKNINEKKQRLLIASLYLLSAIIIFLPGGVDTSIRERIILKQESAQKSPTGYLCYDCKKPAKKSQRYENKTKLYFCEDHWPPPKRVSIHARADKGEYDLLAWFFFLGLYFINYFRVLVHLLSKGRFFTPGHQGAFWAVTVPPLIWIISKIHQPFG